MAFPYSSGDVLTAADLNQSSGLVLVKTQTAGTAVSSMTVTNCFSSTFDNYLLTVTGGTFNTINTQIRGRLVSGSTIVTTGYKSRLLYSLYGTSTPLAASSGQPYVLWWGGTKANATAPVFARLHIFGAFLTDGTFFTSDAYGTDIAAGNSTSYHSTPASYDGFEFHPDTGTMTGCTVRVYGYNNG